jgi:hypothetical protein
MGSTIIIFIKLMEHYGTVAVVVGARLVLEMLFPKVVHNK